MQPELILASSSPTRKQLLDRLGLDYKVIHPNLDESAQNDPSADALAHRLAYEKAFTVALAHPKAVVIGSDQVVYRINQPHEFLGKPLTFDNAVQQLQKHSNQTVCFSTALSVQCIDQNFEKTIIEHYQVKFRELDFNEIMRYIQLDQPLNCAGSFKCESLGISLFEQLKGDDFTSLMGLPLIKLCSILRELNYYIP